MDAALDAGIALRDAWELTPRAVVLMVDAAGRKARRAHEADVAQAWHTAMFTRAKHLKTLRSYLGKTKARPTLAKPTEEQRATARTMLARAIERRQTRRNGG